MGLKESGSIAMRTLHLTLASAALLSLLGACAEPETPAASIAQPDPALLQARLVALTRSVEAAEAVRSVKRLQWAYGHYSELGLWHDFADLFADTGVGHYTQGDLDREQIRALFFDQVGQGRLGLAEGRIYPHISFSPVVTLAEDGSQAKGRFRILAMLGGYGGNATWFHGLYENVYVNEAGVWKLNELSNTAQVTGNFTAGLSPPANRALDVVTFAPHFDPAQVGQVAMTTQAATDELAALQRRLERLADEAAVINLQHQYAYALDRHDWDAVADLFAEQGTFETDQRGVYLGKTSIRNALEQFGAPGLASGDVDDHILFQTYVSLSPDGRSAKVRVDQLGLQGKQGASAEWTQGIYENTFIEEGGQWRIQALHYYPRLITDYNKGWGADAQPAAGPSDTFPPDAPPTESFAAYPAFYIPAFHFAHPVTGRAPQYPEGDPAATKPMVFADAQSQAADAAPLADMEAQLASAEASAQQALAYDAVENLVNAYAYFLDECTTVSAAQLFAEQGEAEIPGVGYYRGPQRIQQALQLAYCPNGREAGVLTLHHVTQPVITTDGRSATVLARLWQVRATAADDDSYASGLLRAEAILENGQWKLATLSTAYNPPVSAREDWADAVVTEVLGYAPPEQMRTEFPPDR